MGHRLLASLAALTFAFASCAVQLTADNPRPLYAPWEGRSVCPVALTAVDERELTHYVEVALRAWEVDREGWRVTRYERDCLPVLLVPDDWVEDWPADDMAETLLVRPEMQPAWVKLRISWWERCPDARLATVTHELGHAVGHAEHTGTRGPMRERLPCLSYGADPPSAEDVAWARLRRSGADLPTDND